MLEKGNFDAFFREKYLTKNRSTALDLVSGPETAQLTDIQVSRSQAHTGIFSLHYYLTGTDSRGERVGWRYRETTTPDCREAVASRLNITDIPDGS